MEEGEPKEVKQNARFGPLRIARQVEIRILWHLEQKIWRKVRGAVGVVQCLYPPGGVLAVKVVADRPCGHRGGGPGARRMKDGDAPKRLQGQEDLVFFLLFRSAPC